MKRFIHALFVLCAVSIFQSANATNSIEGLWQTISDKDGKPESIVRIEKRGNEWIGTIEKLLHPSKPNPLCEKCPDAFANQPIEGLKFLWGLRQTEASETNIQYESGSILDPNNGSIYRLKAKLESEGNVLTIRGYLGVPLLGRSQTWKRLNKEQP